MRERYATSRCCCEEEPTPPPPLCVICRDTFNRADNEDITVDSPCTWVEVGGDASFPESWRIEGGKMIKDGTGLARAYVDQQFADYEEFGMRCVVEGLDAFSVMKVGILPNTSPTTVNMNYRIDVSYNPGTNEWRLELFLFSSAGVRTVVFPSDYAILCLTQSNNQMIASLLPGGSIPNGISVISNSFGNFANSNRFFFDATGGPARLTRVDTIDLDSSLLPGSDCGVCQTRIECGGCAAGSANELLQAYDIDLGITGISNQNCDQCINLAGIIRVRNTDAGTECRWEYCDTDNTCTEPASCNGVHPSCPDLSTQVCVKVRLEEGIGANANKWRLWACVGMDCQDFALDPQCDLDQFPQCTTDRQFSAEYATDYMDEPLDCATLFDNPVTLNRIAEYDGGWQCNGSFPLSITMAEPA